MNLSDERWSQLEGGYRQPYDARPALRRLEAGDASAWNVLWEELHHQGDVGEASYAAVPELVRIYAARTRSDWNTYALASTIEAARLAGGNPPLPDWLAHSYKLAWTRLEAEAIADLPSARDDELVNGILAVLALAKGKATLARMAMLTEDERQEMLDGAG
jgi:hypothetical protein